MSDSRILPEDYKYMPQRLRDPIEKVAAGTGYAPETVFIATLAAQQLAVLSREEQTKAIACILVALGMVSTTKR